MADIAIRHVEKFYGKTHVVQVKGTTWAYNTPKDEEDKK